VTATLVQTLSAGGSPAAKVTWRNPVAGRTEHFRTFCVVFNTSNSQFCALREAIWDLDLDSSRAAAQHATVNADGAATAAPATGVAANNAATATTTVGVGAATTTFTQKPTTAAISGGNGQNAPVNTAFASALQVIAKDVNGNPVSGVTVTFTPPAGGAGGSFSGGNTAVTDATGVATAPAFTANATAGHYSVTAAAAGVAATVRFSLTNTP
jgi:adhesin/invasin